MDAVGFFNRVESYDIGVIPGSDGAGLALEAGEAVRVAGHVGRQDLERDFTAELGVGGAIHVSRTA